MKKNSTFKRGTGCYTCRVCSKQTRETGDSESEVQLCAACFYYAGWENMHSDNGHSESNVDAECPVCVEEFGEIKEISSMGKTVTIIKNFRFRAKIQEALEEQGLHCTVEGSDELHVIDLTDEGLNAIKGFPSVSVGKAIALASNTNLININNSKKESAVKTNKKTTETATTSKKAEKAAEKPVVTTPEKKASKKLPKMDEGGEPIVEKKAKPAKVKREGNIPLAARLLTEGKTEAQIISAFSERYTAQGGHKASADWIGARASIYCKIALKDPKVAKAVEALTAKPAPTEKKAKKAKTESGKAPK